jgi:hypothetical protein
LRADCGIGALQTFSKTTAFRAGIAMGQHDQNMTGGYQLVADLMASIVCNSCYLATAAHAVHQRLLATTKLDKTFSSTGKWQSRYLQQNRSQRKENRFRFTL